MRVVENSKESKDIEEEKEIVFESEFEYDFEDDEILHQYRLDDDFNGAFNSNSKPNVDQSFRTSKLAAQPLPQGAFNSNSKSNVDQSFRTSQFATQPLAQGAFNYNSKPNVDQSFKTTQFATQPLAPGAFNSNSKSNVDQSFRISPFEPNSTSNETNSTPNETNSTSNETNSTSNETFVASDSYGNYVKSILNLDGQGFLPSHPTANGIGDILRSHYTNPWPSWKKIPIRTRDLWFWRVIG
ncbi:hypothetical protein VNO80_03039 [Phaseolus coccineus]|uniref:Uncharacterized protein n=1 Tax=Phaseolus coccineus TaxID=3886 RepID=A0AAN9NR02_PHACN